MLHAQLKVTVTSVSSPWISELSKSEQLALRQGFDAPSLWLAFALRWRSLRVTLRPPYCPFLKSLFLVSWYSLHRSTWVTIFAVNEADACVRGTDLNLKALSKGMLCKQALGAGFGQFLNISSWTCWKRGVHFAKVNPNGTLQVCPKCDAFVRKDFSVKIHCCPQYGYTTDRDVVSAQVIRERGIAAVGQVVEQIACGGDGTGAWVTPSRRSPIETGNPKRNLGNSRLNQRLWSWRMPNV